MCEDTLRRKVIGSVVPQGDGSIPPMLEEEVKQAQLLVTSSSSPSIGGGQPARMDGVTRRGPGGEGPSRSKRQSS